MKFKALIESEAANEPSQLLVLHALQAIQKLERTSERASERRSSGSHATVVMKLTPENFALCHRSGADEGSQTWSHFQPGRLFKEYRIESKRQNRIDLEAPIANLVHIFQSCGGSDRVVVKLANGKDGRPVLAFEFSLTGTVADHVVNQEVPVRVIPETEAEAISEPQMPEPDYQIELPASLARLRGVLDRMRQVGAQHVEVEAALDGSAVGQPQHPGAPASNTSAPSGGVRAWLRLTTESDVVGIATTFPRLALIMEGKSKPPQEGPLKLLLSIKRLGEVLAAFQMLSAEAHIACLLEGKALVLYALLPRRLGSVISYTPGTTT